jgi:PKD repeat protein
MKNLLITGLLLFVVAAGQAQAPEEFFFNNNFIPTSAGKPLINRISCTAVPGAFDSTDVTTAEGFCIRTVAYRFNDGEGLEYQNTSISDQYSINLFFKFNTLGSYARIIDFSNGNTDSGIYLLGNCLNFYPTGNIGTCPFFQPDIFYLLTLVRNAANNEISVYVNGTLFTTYTDAGNIYRPASTQTPILFFLDDNVFECENQPGWIKYISVSRNLLNAGQVDSIWNQICEIAVNECDTAKPQGQFTYQPGEAEYEIVFDGTSPRAEYYLWDFGNGDTSTARNPSHVFPYDGVWPVTLVAGNSCGNDTITRDIMVLKTDIMDLWPVKNLHVFPNPGERDVFIAGTSDRRKDLSVSIYNVEGCLVRTIILSGIEGDFTAPLTTGDLPAGFYLLNISDTHRSRMIPWVRF